MNFCGRLAVEFSVRIPTVVKSDHRNVDGRAVEDPVAITLGEEDVTSLFDALQDFAVFAAADTLGGEQARATESFPLDHVTCLLKPVAAEVASARYALVPNFEHGVDVLFAEVGPQEPAPQERRISDNKIRLRPFGLGRVGRVG